MCLIPGGCRDCIWVPEKSKPVVLSTGSQTLSSSRELETGLAQRMHIGAAPAQAVSSEDAWSLLARVVAHPAQRC